MRNGEETPGDALTLAYLSVSAVVAAVLAALFSFGFQLGFRPLVISPGLLVVLVITVALVTGQFKATAAAGTRLTLAYMALVCLLAGIAATGPTAFPDLMLWSLAAFAGTAAGAISVEDWITGKIDADGPFSRRLSQEAHGLLILSVTVLLWQSSRVDGWILAVGGLHYVRLVLSWFFPALRQSSAVPWRPYLRFALVIALAAALVPAVPMSLAIALGALALGFGLTVVAADIDTARA